MGKGYKEKFPSVVAIDTQILIYAWRTKFADEEQEEKNKRAKELLRRIHDANSRICLSAIVVGEYLTGIEAAKRPTTLLDISERFDVAVFNLRAAMVVADLFPMMKQVRRGDRNVLLSDSKIIASVIAHPCKLFYTHDSDLCKVNFPPLTIKPLPPRQELF